MALTLVQGGRSAPPAAGPSSSGSRGRVLTPRAALARRAGITPTAVPADLFVSPALLGDVVDVRDAATARRHRLRVVA